MAERTQREIREQDVQGLKHLRKIRPLLCRLRKVGTERDKAGNRRLFMDQSCMLILISTGEKPNRGDRGFDFLNSTHGRQHTGRVRCIALLCAVALAYGLQLKHSPQR